jgi:hypothetical protein
MTRGTILSQELVERDRLPYPEAMHKQLDLGLLAEPNSASQTLAQEDQAGPRQSKGGIGVPAIGKNLERP